MFDVMFGGVAILRLIEDSLSMRAKYFLSSYLQTVKSSTYGSPNSPHPCGLYLLRIL